MNRNENVVDGYRQFQRMVTRLVWLDAARSFATAMGIIVAVQAFIVRYIPPWVIRDEVQRANSSSRSVGLVILLLVYVGLTTPLVRVLMGSRRLQVFRHWPVPASVWRRLHGKHLLWLNLPWFGVAAYSLFWGKYKPELWHACLSWGGWCVVTVGLQLLALHRPFRTRRLLTLFFWGCFTFILVLLLRSSSWWGGLIALSLGVGAIVWGLWVPVVEGDGRRNARLLAPKSPWQAWVRIEGLTLWRQERRWLWTVMGMIGVLLGLFSLAIVNNKLRDPSILFAIAAGVMLPAMLLTASMLLRGQRWMAGYSWFSLHLGVSATLSWSARFFVGWMLSWSVWILLWCTILLSGAFLPFQWVVALAFSGFSIGAWAIALTLYLAALAENHDRLEDPLLWVLLGHAMPLVVLVAFFPYLSFALVLVGAIYAKLGLTQLEDLQRKRTRNPGPRALVSHH